jgi:Flp pilus assembly protein TadG
MKTARQSGQFRSDESGATAVEFGLVAAMFCFLVVGLTDFGMSYWQKDPGWQCSKGRSSIRHD